MSRAWFRPKRYGYGATPTTWQGWASMVAFVAVLAAIMAFVPGWPRWVGVAIAIALFSVLACAKTDGGCRWRWGKRET